MVEQEKMAESTKVAVSPLTGSNYSTWKIQCKMALIKENLWGIIDGTDKPPAEDASADRQAKYKARRDKALATIIVNVDPSLLYLLGEPVDPCIVWTKLSEQFQKKTWANKLVLRRRLVAKTERGRLRPATYKGDDGDI